jgi:flagellar capping protein FliD
MILNARRMHFKEELKVQPIILLAIEDITDIMGVADMLTAHTNQFRDKMTDRTKKLENQIKKLEKEITKLKKR